MNIAFYSTLPFEQTWFASYTNHAITYIPQALTEQTADMAKGHRAVCAFVNDDLSRPVLQILKQQGVSVVGMRCVGLDNVDQEAMADLGLTLLNIPGHSPYSVAEQAVALLLGLVRHLPEASQRVQLGNFSIDGLIGNDLHGKTVGVIGAGRIGSVFARIMLGFGCNVLIYDIRHNPKLIEAGAQYRLLSDLLAQSDILSLHCPLTQLTDHIINPQTIAALKPSTVLVNTARGRLVDAKAVLDALDAGKLAGYAADVYEQERAYFHYDYSRKSIADDILNQLRNHPKVLLTAHQGFLTEEALQQMARNLLNQFTFYDSQQMIMVTKASMC
ncbi:2-hydroxyacid dehydrogenase [Spirosoma aureum]|uniref:2-hydroxyacid dehydrogenase n=1 Tax=Spirosoma aureum TaxID=2692134 RepID=A0A6G9ARN1_9BACT|nr:2-hydroxyacid dehydrogenase [Spirosoma aureum]QIP15131.1 2-hydroxyacid dehydrogenase [Spirosoma aureum]